MDLSRLVKKYEKLLSVESTSTEGSYVDGRWVKPETVTREFYGTALNLSTEDLKTYEAGTYTTKDIKIFVIQGLTDTTGEALTLAEGEIVIKNDNRYEIKKILDGCDIAGFKKIIAKKVVIHD